MITRLKELRQARGITQLQLALETHVTPRTIISIETGQYNPSLMLAYRLALALDTTIEELCCLPENLEKENRRYEENP